MEITNKKLILIALIIGLFAATFFYLYLAKLENDSKKLEPTEAVIVARVNILPKTKITKEMIEYKEMKVNTVPAASFSDPSKVIGQIVKETIYTGEPVIANRLADEQYRREHLAYIIPTAHRAITLQYNPVMGVGGLIRPGDYVDIVGTYDPDYSPDNNDVSKIILQNILVLAINKDTGNEPDQESAEILTITLAVTPKEAEKLTYTDEKASIRLLLRPLNEDKKSSTSGTTKENIFTP